MFDYFCKLQHTWPTNVNPNKYEHVMLLDLIKKGHTEPEKKIGTGIEAFMTRYHPTWKNRCFFFVREDQIVGRFQFQEICEPHTLVAPMTRESRQRLTKKTAAGHVAEEEAGGEVWEWGWLLMEDETKSISGGPSVLYQNNLLQK